MLPISLPSLDPTPSSMCAPAQLVQLCTLRVANLNCSSNCGRPSSTSGSRMPGMLPDGAAAASVARVLKGSVAWWCRPPAVAWNRSCRSAPWAASRGMPGARGGQGRMRGRGGMMVAYAPPCCRLVGVIIRHQQQCNLTSECAEALVGPQQLPGVSGWVRLAKHDRRRQPRGAAAVGGSSTEVMLCAGAARHNGHTQGRAETTAGKKVAR